MLSQRVAALVIAGEAPGGEHRNRVASALGM